MSGQKTEPCFCMNAWKGRAKKRGVKVPSEERRMCTVYYEYKIVNVQHLRNKCLSLKVHKIEIFCFDFEICNTSFISYVKILRFCKNKFLIGPVLKEVRFFHTVLRLRGMEKNFEVGKKKIYFFIYEPFIWAKTSFSEIWSINCARDGFMRWPWAKMSKFILLSLRLSGIEFNLVSD
jgi:hypothetical protein